jgi:rhamnose utilization protein RhaD (predicted bifunctional aldolase and dehydrogenase)
MPDDAEFRALLTLSARLGRDSTRTQAAGGNTSLKRDGVLSIKASGTWLADAETRDIMVPVDLAPLLAALRAGDPRVERAIEFVPQEPNPHGLRPSVETAVHAVIPFPVVVHIHCVNTIAVAVRADAATLVRERLASLADAAPAFIPYVQPGVPLARVIARLPPATNVIVLGNHGLVVAGATVAATEDLLERVCAAFAAPRRPGGRADLAGLAALAAGSPYRLPADALAHDVATDPDSLAIARQGTLYPDHVVFLGPGIVVLEGRSIREVLDQCETANLPPPPMLVLPGRGVLLHASVLRGADELARGLAEVAARIPRSARLTLLTREHENQLVHWDAEIYRRALAGRSRRSG